MMSHYLTTALPKIVMLVATIGIYGISQRMGRRLRFFSPAHRLLLSAACVFILLKLARISYTEYKLSGDWLTFWLGPATVALAVPLHRHSLALQKHLPLALLSVVLGSLSAILSAGWLLLSLGGSAQATISMMPKSATTAISMEISQQIGGVPEWTAIFTVVTGLLGALLGPSLLRWMGIRDDVVIGTAIGTAAHGIGTARVLEESEVQGSASALAMTLAGVVTSLIFMVLQWLT